MRNQYFLKDKKALIYQKQPESQDEEGYPIPGGWKPTSSSALWCYTRQLSQDTIVEAAKYGAQETRMFVFNPMKVNLYDLILYRGAWYQVTRVDTEDDYNTDVFIYVKDCPAKDIPKDSQLLPY